MRIASPPDFSELQKEYIFHLVSITSKASKLLTSNENNQLSASEFQIREYSEFSVTDEKGRYLHWDKFRRIHSHDTRMKWRAVKDSRLKIQKSVHFPFDKIFKFCVPDSLQAQLHLIDKTCGSHIGTNSLTGFGKQDQSKFLLKSLIMEEAITSAQLEGAATTRKVAKDMLKTQRKPTTKDEIMIVNNYQLMRYAVEQKDKPLSKDLILTMHRIATSNAIENHAVSGQFRQDNGIFIADRDGNNIYQPPEYIQINELMDTLCDFANREHDGIQEQFIHPVAKAIMLHFLIGYIHPFGDGNGRTARALFYWFMLKKGYWLFEYMSISRLLKNAPAKYAKAYLYSESDDLDMTYFIYYQLGIIRKAFEDLEAYITNKQKQSKEFTAFIAKYTGGLNHRQIGILQKAVEESGKVFTANEIASEYGVSLNTARSDLSLLSKQGFLVQFKSGNALEYISPQNLLRRLEANRAS